MFTIPAYQDLSAEQDIVYSLPLEGMHLVIGPPGTGKTIMAIYRASQFQAAGLSSQFFVYNKTLQQHVEQTTGRQGIACASVTFHSWFWTFYRSEFRRRPPEIEPFVYNWNQIYQQLARKGTGLPKLDNIIIDEGQDFPQEFYVAMLMLARNVTVFADENQRITATQSTIQEIRECIGAREVLKLTRNYRNTEPIARFSRYFYSDLQSGMPELPKRQGPKPRLFHLTDVDDQVERIVTHVLNYPDRQVAVFVRTGNQRDMLYNLIRKRLRERGIKSSVQKYESGNRRHSQVDFLKSGVFVLAYASAKGLEFDTVFLPLLDQNGVNRNPETEKMHYYVLTSRARQELYLLTGSDTVPSFMEDAPERLYQSKNYRG